MRYFITKDKCGYAMWAGRPTLEEQRYWGKKSTCIYSHYNKGVFEKLFPDFKVLEDTLEDIVEIRIVPKGRTKQND